jgi:hypothetical protein
MNKFKSGLINTVFFIGGDLAYSLFTFGRVIHIYTFLGSLIIILLFFTLHKLDRLLSIGSKKGTAAQKEEKYTNWLLSAMIGATFAFSSNGSILLRWLYTS